METPESGSRTIDGQLGRWAIWALALVGVAGCAGAHDPRDPSPGGPTRPRAGPVVTVSSTIGEAREVARFPDGSTSWVAGSVRAEIGPEGTIDLAGDLPALPIIRAVELADGWFFVDAAGAIFRTSDFLDDLGLVHGVRAFRVSRREGHADFAHYELFTVSRGRLVVRDSGPGWGRFRSSTGGDFELLSVPPRTRQVAFYDADFGVARTDGGFVHRTNDGGQTWRRVRIGRGTRGGLEVREEGIAVPFEDAGHRVAAWVTSFGPHLILRPDGSSTEVDLALEREPVVRRDPEVSERIAERAFRAFPELRKISAWTSSGVGLVGGLGLSPRLIDAEGATRGLLRARRLDVVVPWGADAFAGWDMDRSAWVRIDGAGRVRRLSVPTDPERPLIATAFAPDGRRWGYAPCAIEIGGAAGDEALVLPPSGHCVRRFVFGPADELVTTLATQGRVRDGAWIVDVSSGRWRSLCTEPPIDTPLETLQRVGSSDVLVAGNTRYFAVGDPRECLKLRRLPHLSHSVAFADPLHGVSWGDDGAWSTEDGGARWSRLHAVVRGGERASLPPLGEVQCSTLGCDVGWVSVRWRSDEHARDPIGVFYAEEDDVEWAPSLPGRAVVCAPTEAEAPLRPRGGAVHLHGRAQGVWAELRRNRLRVTWGPRSSAVIALGDVASCDLDLGAQLRVAAAADSAAVLHCYSTDSCRCEASYFWFPAGGRGRALRMRGHLMDVRASATIEEDTVLFLDSISGTRVVRIDTSGEDRGSPHLDFFRDRHEGLLVSDGEVRHLVVYDHGALVSAADGPDPEYVAGPAVPLPLSSCEAGEGPGDRAILAIELDVEGEAWPHWGTGNASARIRLWSDGACIEGLTIVGDDGTFELHAEAGAFVGPFESERGTRAVRCTWLVDELE